MNDASPQATHYIHIADNLIPVIVTLGLGFGQVYVTVAAPNRCHPVGHRMVVSIGAVYPR